ncbi:tetratricopeptide repeat-containing sensor histidine kinase [Marinigracilibium pacificum]|uniref:histidine kinase n=1 Tax=Marinigracilibium pacificum TaxID=2729599 RepID=A0A848IUI4_9BACT|nr:tetratricopeptide repeat protein [Marinigracilibium pacificum]NMM48163.1 sensor histidine kinase [Marinigracilibium pacificum]
MFLKHNILFILLILSLSSHAIIGQKSEDRFISEDSLQSIIDELRTYQGATSEEQYNLAFLGDSLAKVNKDTFFIIEFKIELGYLSQYDTKFNEAINYYDEGLALEKLSRNYKQRFELKRLKSIVYDRLGQFKMATDTLLDALGTVVLENDTTRMINGYNSLGIFYKRAGFYENALKYYLLNYELSSKTGSDIQYLISANNLAIMHKFLGNTSEAYVLLDSVFRQTNVEYEYIKYGTIHNLGSILSADGKYEKAEKLITESLNWSIESNDKYRIAQNLYELAVINYKTGKYKKALEQFNEVLTRYQVLNDPEKMMDTYQELTRVHEALNNTTEALSNYKKYSLLSDSLLSAKKTEEMAMNEAIFQNKIHGEQLNALKAEEELSKQKINSRNIYIIGLSIILFSFIIISYVVHRKNRLIARQKSEIEKMNNALIKSNHKITNQHDQLIIKNKKVQAQNEELESLMAIVAHDLKSPLNKIKGLNDILNYTELNEDQKDIISRIQSITEQGRNLIEELCFLNNLEANTDSVNIDTFDPLALIVEKVSEYQSEASSKNIDLNYAIDSKLNLFNSDRAYIRRIIDNILSNAIKFSPKNSQIDIYLHGNDDIELTIADHGQGFSEDDKKLIFQKFKRLSATPTAGESSTGLGLSIVKLLIDKIKGDIKVLDTSGGGATFKIVIPDLKKLNEKKSALI